MHFKRTALLSSIHSTLWTAETKKLLLAMTSSAARSHRTINKTIRLAMKLTAFILLSACMIASAKGNTQGVTLSVKNAPLETVFKELKKQTGYQFLYNNQMLDGSKKVSINISNGTIEQVLELCFKDQALTYTIVDKTIIVKEKEKSPNEEANLRNEPPPPIDVKGRITNEAGEPVAATVTVKGTNNATATDADGNFTLKNVDENATLVITGVSIQTFETKVNGKTNFELTARIKISSLNEVIVNKGYYTEKQKYSVSNVGKVTSKDIEKQPVNNPLLALQGRVPGLFITQTSGMPGSGVTIRIIGQNSIGNGNDPLIVIDGVPIISQNLKTFQGPSLGNSSATQAITQGTRGNPLSYINPADIESVEILKDADATAIYGSRAANGAILITTKKGRTGATKIDINIQQGWGNVGHFLNLLNTQQYMEMRKEAKRNDNASTLSSDYDLNGLWDTTRYTDWQKVLIGGTAHFGRYSTTLSGGSNNVHYLVGSTYQKETTVFPGDFSDTKGSVHFNIDATTTSQKFKMQFSGSYLTDKSNLPGIDFTNNIYLAPVAPSLYNNDGTLNWAPNSTGVSSWDNPLAQSYNLYDTKSTSLISNMVLGYHITPDLEFKSSLGYTSMMSNEFVGNLITAIRPEDRPNYTRSAIFSFNSVKSWIIEPQINYRKNLSKAALDFSLGSTFQYQENDGKVLTASGQANDQLLRDLKSATTISSGSSDISTYKYNAIFGRLNCVWDRKYIVNATARRDGSSRFGYKNRFHNFGSLGAAWIFTEESFFTKSKSILSFGKLKASYGTTGNEQIGNYSYLDLYNSFNVGNPYQGTSSLVSSGLVNPYLQWEETRKLQLGIDLSFFSDRFLVNANYVKNRSSNQLVPYSLPSITGFSSINSNFPALVENSEWEFVLNINPLKSEKIKWSSTFNLTIPENKLISFPDLAKSSYSFLLLGQPLTSSFPAYRFYGVDPITGTYLVQDKNGNPTASPNSATDRLVPINPFPKFYGGFQNSLSFKGFQFDFLCQFIKQQNFNFFQTNASPGNFNLAKGNQPASVLNRWRNPGDLTTVQRYTSDTRLLTFQAGDRTLTDVSFLRLKNISLAYDFLEKVVKKSKLQALRLYVNAQNVFTLTNYKGLDPENRNFSALPPLRVITLGIQASL